MDYNELVKRLQTGHDSQCAMSYGMHEHCCDCSYVDRQDAADAIVALQADLAAARADAERWQRIVTEIADDDGCSCSTARLIDAAIAGGAQAMSIAPGYGSAAELRAQLEQSRADLAAARARVAELVEERDEWKDRWRWERSHGCPDWGNHTSDGKDRVCWHRLPESWHDLRADKDRAESDLAAARALLDKANKAGGFWADRCGKAAAALADTRAALLKAKAALEHHQQQTRPIHSTAEALAAIDAALAGERKE